MFFFVIEIAIIGEFLFVFYYKLPNVIFGKMASNIWNLNWHTLKIELKFITIFLLNFNNLDFFVFSHGK